MPVRRFFAMLKASRVLHTRRLLEMADLHAVSICSVKYHETLVDRYQQRLDFLTGFNPYEEENHESAKALQPEEADNTMIQMLSLQKKVMGYGG